MTFRDVLVLVPAIPALVLVITWWLPWERWFPWSRVLGFPFVVYAAYLAFASWYFRLGWVAESLCAVAMMVGISMHLVRRLQRSPQPPSHRGV